MSTTTVARITIEADGKLRSIMKIMSNKNGDVYLILKSAKQYRAAHDQDKSSDIVEQRYSIHPSRRSDSGINVIKQTLKLADRRTIRTAQHTKAIKRGDRYAPIYSRCFPNPSPQRYDVSADNAQNLCLGAIDVRRCTLIAAVFCGAASTMFDEALGIGADFGITQFTVNNVNILVLWSFIAFPAGPWGDLLHTLTVPPEIVYQDIIEGLSIDDCIVWFYFVRERLRLKCVEHSISASPDLYWFFVNNRRFFPHGVIDELAWQQYLAETKVRNFFGVTSSAF